MVIRDFNVQANSQRTFFSSESSPGGMSGQFDSSAHFLRALGGYLGNSNGDNNPQVLHANNQGNNSNGQGQIGNGQHSQGNNGNGQGQIRNDRRSHGNIGNGQGQNRNGSSTIVDEAGNDNETIDGTRRTRRSVPLWRTHGARRGQKNVQGMPFNPLQLRARLMQIVFQMLTGGDGADDWIMRNVDDDGNFRTGISGSFSFFSSFAGNGVRQLQGADAAQNVSFSFESETVRYHASGVVHTADGRTIEFDVSMHLSREFVSFTGLPPGGTLVDPLVINYGGTAASLIGERFYFDLTSDGEKDNIAMLGPGSGFLAIDRNGDGIINDGSELFGPNTGCGFSELRKYDSDGNGWIDHNDDVFDKLVIWRRNPDGTDTVKTLKEAGIGAIFLGEVSTEFSFRDEDNETLGVMRSTSFFLKQCGNAGTLSHIDLAL